MNHSTPCRLIHRLIVRTGLLVQHVSLKEPGCVPIVQEKVGKAIVKGQVGFPGSESATRPHPSSPILPLFSPPFLQRLSY